MQINRNEQSDLNAFIADLKKLGFEVEVKDGYIGFMMPDHNGKPTFMVSLPYDLYRFYPTTNAIQNGYGKAFAVEKKEKSYLTVLTVSSTGQTTIENTFVEYFEYAPND